MADKPCITSDFDLKGEGWADFRTVRVQVAPLIIRGKKLFETKPAIDDKSVLSL